MTSNEIDGPKVNFKLLPFQREAVLHLRRQRSRLIGDDMGLGKTYEAIMLDLLNRYDAVQAENRGEYKGPPIRKTLIIAPKSVLPHWEDKTEELTKLGVFVIDPKNRDKFLKHALTMDKAHSGYYIMHWEALRLMPDLAKVPWFHIIADECHRMKGRKTQTTRAVKRLRASYKTAMSGTAADNKPQDLWQVLNWLWPSYYTSYWRFVNALVEWETAATKEGNQYKKMVGLNLPNVRALNKEMQPWYVRRLKEDVLQDLPDKYYDRVWVDLHPKQRKAYNEMASKMVAWLERPEIAGRIEREDPMIASVVVAQLMRLQQFAIGYMEYAGTKLVWKTDKKTGLKEQVEVDVFNMIEPSAKLDALMEILEDTGGQVVVFSQFKSTINLLAKRLEAAQIPHGLLTGDTKQSDRGRLVREFQAGELRVFAGTIAAGGVGITLTASSTVVFLDRAWNPGINKQAEDRLHRIGQLNAVQVIDLMARNSVDLGRHQQLETKMSWLKAILGDK